MKIAIFANSFPAPSETFILNQVLNLSSIGHEIHVFAYRNKSKSVIHPAYNQKNIVFYVHHPWRIAPNLTIRKLIAWFNWMMVFGKKNKCLSSLKEKEFGEISKNYYLMYWACLMARNQGFDVAHAHFVSVGGLAGMLKSLRLLNCALVTSFHGADVTSSTNDIQERVFSKFAREQSNIFTFNSFFIKEKAIERGFDAMKMRHLPVGFEIDRFPYVERNGRRGKCKILSVARLAEAKGIHIALQAMRILKGQKVEFSYEVIGDGPWREQLQQMIASFGLDDCVVLQGWKAQDGVAEALGDSDIFILPSITASDGIAEGQGLALQEAQATGLPLVATMHNGFPENIQEGETGFLVPESDAISLADAIKKLVVNQNLRIQMGLAGRHYVEQRFDSKMLVKKHEGILEEAIELEHYKRFSK